jgi:FkbM family methyltransferase
MAKNRIYDIPARAINKFRRHFFPVDFDLLDGFLNEVAGVIHIGANMGQERESYASLGLNVVWVEPIPAVFEKLRSNISGLSNQRAYRYLLAAEDGRDYKLHIADNGGASSSILDFAKHRKLHPDIHYVEEIQVKATTLVRLIEIEKIDLNDYGAIVLDTQGSELLVLKGAIPVLDKFRFVKTEVADFESYAGCCQLAELTEFMRELGFVVSHKAPVVALDGVGTYYDVVYGRP